MYGYSIDTEGLNFDTTIDSVSIPIPVVDSNLKDHYGEKEKEK